MPETPAAPCPKKRARTGGVSSGAAAGVNKVLEEQLECVICREVMVGAHALVPCGHAFCAECAHQWLAHKNACPTCRKKTTADPVPVLPLDALVKRLVVPGLGPAKRAAFAEREERWQARRAEMREKAEATRTAPPPPRGPDFMATFVTVAPPPDGDGASSPGGRGASLSGRILRTPVVIHGRLPGGPPGEDGEQPDVPFPFPPAIASVLQALASQAPGAMQATGPGSRNPLTLPHFGQMGIRVVPRAAPRNRRPPGPRPPGPGGSGPGGPTGLRTRGAPDDAPPRGAPTRGAPTRNHSQRGQPRGTGPPGAPRAPGASGGRE